MEERRDERHGLITNGRYRTGKGMPMDIVLQDLSRSGCQIHDKLGHLDVGQFLTIRIGPIGPIEAHVRWLNGRMAGIQFDTPLNDAVLDHIRSISSPAPTKPRPRSAERSDTGEPSVTRLPLTERERAFAAAIGALEVDAQYREVLAGLDRNESEWLVEWRGLLVHERRQRPQYHQEVLVAEQLEETHEVRRRNKHPF